MADPDWCDGDYLNQNKTPINRAFHFDVTQADGVGVEVALQWNDSFQQKLVETLSDHGFHNALNFRRYQLFFGLR